MLPRSQNYLNSDRNRSRPKIESLDDAIGIYRENLATDAYMRDSLGFVQADFEILAPNGDACDSLRMRVAGILESLGLSFHAGELDRMELGQAEGYRINPGVIPVASAYFSLRDSLMKLRTPSIGVRVREIPYSSPFRSDGDSSLEFLQRLRVLTQSESGAFRKRLLESFRMTGMDYPYTLGVNCTIAVGRLLTRKEIREMTKAGLPEHPGSMLRLRDRPFALRIESLENVSWAAFALSIVAALLSLGLAVVFAVRHLRKRRARTRKAGPPAAGKPAA